MGKAGIVGGLGPESTIEYYKSIIGSFQKAHNSQKVLPNLVINSIDMYKVFDYIDAKDLNGLADYLTFAVNELEAAGAEFAAISANTPHIVFDQVKFRSNIPLISIVEETVKEVLKQGINRVGLIGTRFTMENDFFKVPFLNANVTPIVPNVEEQRFIHEKTVDELENGIISRETKTAFLNIINRMVTEDGIQGLILGCTEHPMLIKLEDTTVPLFNTTAIHVNAISKLL